MNSYWLLVIHCDRMVRLRTFLHFSLESNLQILRNYAIKHLEETFNNDGP